MGNVLVCPDHWSSKNVADVVGHRIFIGFISHSLKHRYFSKVTNILATSCPFSLKKPYNKPMLYFAAPGGPDPFGLCYIGQWKLKVTLGQHHQVVLLCPSHRNTNCFLFSVLSRMKKRCLPHIISLFQRPW